MIPDQTHGARSIDLEDGAREERRIENRSRGPLMVWAGLAHVATLAPGERALFIPGEDGWRRWLGWRNHGAIA